MHAHAHPRFHRIAWRARRLGLAIPLLAGSGSLTGATAASTSCIGPGALGVSRTLEIDAATGGLYGSLSSRTNHPDLLGKKEVALTFDDGPMPWVTRSILDTLERSCAKATFFSVGRMALAYPATVRDILARGHTLGTHTFSHPYNMPRMKQEAAKAEIEQGVAAVAAAAGAPIAPFFRFTGLNDSAPLISYLGERGMAAFTVDVVSNDSYIADPADLTARTLAAIDARKGGIVLFHDIKTATAKALPGILAGLKARGYALVHFVPKAPAEPRLDLLASYTQRVAKAMDVAASSKKMPFYGAVGPLPLKAAVAEDAPASPRAAAKQASSAQANGAPSQATALQPVARTGIRGGLDLSQKPKEHHPGTLVFSAGFPAFASDDTGSQPAASGATSWAILPAVGEWAAEVVTPDASTPKPKRKP